jgi:TorA maturation chaperone TorD
MVMALKEAGVDVGPDFANEDAGALQHRLAVDYTQLFHAPANPADRVSPYEGLFTGVDESLSESRTDAARHFMGDVGFEVAEGAGEMADHSARSRGARHSRHGACRYRQRHRASFCGRPYGTMG